MVETPWGDTDAFRDRRLPPGRASDRDAIEKNQRGRLFGAMVASVAERGYAKTRVADLVEISGVSSRSFYGFFDDKEDCFVAALQVLLAGTVDRALETSWEGPWEEVARERLARFDRLVAAESAAARMCLIEAPVVGGRAIKMLDDAVGRAEGLLRAALRESPERSEMSAEMSTVAIGAILEVARMRILRGDAADLLKVEDDLLGLLLSVRPPSGALRSAARAPGRRDEESEAGDHAERAMRAFEALLTEQPYRDTTMEQIAKRATMSVRTLYANFDGVEEIMLASIDSAAAQVNAVTQPAARRSPNLVEGIRAAIVAFFGLLASRPNLANLLLEGAHAGGSRALIRRAEALRPFEELLGRVHQTVPRADDARLSSRRSLATEAILGGILALSRKRMRESGPQGLLGLVPISTYLVLAPALRADDATLVAEGKSYRRRSEVERLLGAVSEIGDDKLVAALGTGAHRVEDLAKITSIPRGLLRSRLAELATAGLVRSVQKPEEGEEPFYESRWSLVPTTSWGEIDRADRERISAEVIGASRADVERALDHKTFDARSDRHLVRMPMWLDETGWRELSEALDLTIETCVRIQKAAEARSANASLHGTPGRVLLASFEMPPIAEGAGQISPLEDDDTNRR